MFKTTDSRVQKHAEQSDQTDLQRKEHSIDYIRPFILKGLNGIDFRSFIA
jgi:hypothetical protein